MFCSDVKAFLTTRQSPLQAVFWSIGLVCVLWSTLTRLKVWHYVYFTCKIPQKFDVTVAEDKTTTMMMMMMTVNFYTSWKVKFQASKFVKTCSETVVQHVQTEWQMRRYKKPVIYIQDRASELTSNYNGWWVGASASGSNKRINSSARLMRKPIDVNAASRLMILLACGADDVSRSSVFGRWPSILLHRYRITVTLVTLMNVFCQTSQWHNALFL